VGFFLFGVGTVALGQFLFGVRSRFWENPPLSFGEVVLVAAGFLAAMFGMFFGWWVALNVPVRDDRAAYRIATVWHFQACGVLVWVFLLGLATTRALGAAVAKEHLNAMNEWYVVGAALGVTAIGASLMGVAVLLTGQFSPDQKPSFVGSVIAVLPVALGMGYLEFWLLDLPGHDWAVAGVVLAVASPPVASYFIQRDVEERKKLIHGGAGEDEE
jgi:hypothetical protein